MALSEVVVVPVLNVDSAAKVLETAATEFKSSPNKLAPPPPSVLLLDTDKELLEVVEFE